MNITQRVENILKVSQPARDSDKELILIYMQKSGMDLSPQQMQTFKKMPSTETIRRVRQQLQMQGKYPASEEVEEARYKKYTEVKQDIQNETAEEALDRQGYKVIYD